MFLFYESKILKDLGCKWIKKNDGNIIKEINGMEKNIWKKGNKNVVKRNN